jgi:Beta-lactamase enzyme family
MDAALLSGMTKLQTPATVRWMPERLEPGFAKNEDLQSDLDLAVTGGFDSTPPDQATKLTKHAFAVVDLTDNPAAPAYAGWKDTEHWLIASLAKLLPLYGAFDLRRALRAAWPTYAPDFAALASAAHAGLVPFGVPSGTRPLITDLYERNSAGEIDFKVGGSPGPRYDDEAPPQYLSRIFWRTPPIGPQRVARAAGQLGTDTVLKAELQDNLLQGRVPAEDQLRLMAGWSDNVSAGVVTQALGFPYLWSLARTSGLWRPKWPELTGHETEKPKNGGLKDGGLNLMSDYNDSGTWKGAPAGAPTKTTQGATARSLACLMTMLARDKLVDPTSDAVIREMLRKKWLAATYRGEDSPIGEGLRFGGWSAVQTPVAYGSGATQPPGSDLAVSKIGLLHSTRPKGPKAASNALIVRTTRELTAGGQKTITAVLVGLNHTDDDVTPLQDFGRRMAKVLDQRHGLKTTPMPPAPE